MRRAMTEEVMSGKTLYEKLWTSHVLLVRTGGIMGSEG